MAGRRSGPIYLHKKSLLLSELNNDVFNNLAMRIPQEFLKQCNCASYGTFSKYLEQTKKGEIDMVQALHRLSNEDWSVERLVDELIEVDNRLALKELLYFWPVEFVTEPPSEVVLAPREQLCVDIQVRGFPAPEISWFFPNMSSAGVGTSLVLDYDGLPEGEYYVKAENSRFHSQKRRRYQQVVMKSFIVKCNNQKASLQPKQEMAEEEEGDPNIRPPPALPEAVPKAPGPPQHQAVRKVALLIAMCNYPDSKIRAGYYDLPDLAQALSKLGFRVVTLIDPPRKDLLTALKLYAAQLNEGVYGFLYLGGHGERCPQLCDDYLIPVDAPTKHRGYNDLLSRSQVTELLQQRSPSLNVIIWDACRQPNDDLVDMESACPKNITETNLILFFSCVASQKAYEVKNGGKVRSLLVLRLLELLANDGDGPNANSFFLALGRRLKESIMCKIGADGEKTKVSANPVLNCGEFMGRSLWDPVTSDPVPDSTAHIATKLWNESCSLQKGIFPMPEISFGPGLTPDSFRLLFHAHNILQLRLFSSSNAAFDFDQLSADLEGANFDPDFVCAQRECGRPGLFLKLTLHHLQLLQPPNGSSDLALPVRLLPSGQSSQILLKDLHLLRLFKVGSHSLD